MYHSYLCVPELNTKPQSSVEGKMNTFSLVFLHEYALTYSASTLCNNPALLQNFCWLDRKTFMISTAIWTMQKFSLHPSWHAQVCDVILSKFRRKGVWFTNVRSLIASLFNSVGWDCVKPAESNSVWFCFAGPNICCWTPRYIVHRRRSTKGC